jgi:hypothetical protein
LEQECARPDDFYQYLELIEFQAARIENTKTTSLSSNLVQMVCDRATVLMTGIAEFFNCALIYFSSNFAGRSPYRIVLITVNLAKSVAGGAATYEDGKRKLTAAINIYDQALLDLAVNILAGNPVVSTSDDRKQSRTRNC